jgi:hypothetical protein
MIERFNIKEILGLMIWLDIIILAGMAYIILSSNNAQKDRKIIYNLLKRLSGDMPN